MAYPSFDPQNAVHDINEPDPDTTLTTTSDVGAVSPGENDSNEAQASPPSAKFAPLAGEFTFAAPMAATAPLFRFPGPSTSEAPLTAPFSFSDASTSGAPFTAPFSFSGPSTSEAPFTAPFSFSSPSTSGAPPSVPFSFSGPSTFEAPAVPVLNFSAPSASAVAEDNPAPALPEGFSEYYRVTYPITYSVTGGPYPDIPSNRIFGEKPGATEEQISQRKKAQLRRRKPNPPKRDLIKLLQPEALKKMVFLYCAKVYGFSVHPGVLFTLKCKTVRNSMVFRHSYWFSAPNSAPQEFSMAALLYEPLAQEEIPALAQESPALAGYSMALIKREPQTLAHGAPAHTSPVLALTIMALSALAVMPDLTRKLIKKLKNELVCLGCNNRGHLIERCEKKDAPKCPYCKKAGHTFNSCKNKPASAPPTIKTGEDDFEPEATATGTTSPVNEAEETVADFKATEATSPINEAGETVADFEAAGTPPPVDEPEVTGSTLPVSDSPATGAASLVGDGEEIVPSITGLEARKRSVSKFIFKRTTSPRVKKQKSPNEVRLHWWARKNAEEPTHVGPAPKTPLRKFGERQSAFKARKTSRRFEERQFAIQAHETPRGGFEEFLHLKRLFFPAPETPLRKFEECPRPESVIEKDLAVQDSPPSLGPLQLGRPFEEPPPFEESTRYVRSPYKELDSLDLGGDFATDVQSSLKVKLIETLNLKQAEDNSDSEMKNMDRKMTEAQGPGRDFNAFHREIKSIDTKISEAPSLQWTLKLFGRDMKSVDRTIQDVGRWIVKRNWPCIVTRSNTCVHVEYLAPAENSDAIDGPDHSGGGRGGNDDRDDGDDSDDADDADDHQPPPGPSGSSPDSSSDERNDSSSPDQYDSPNSADNDDRTGPSDNDHDSLFSGEGSCATDFADSMTLSSPNVESELTIGSAITDADAIQDSRQNSNDDDDAHEPSWETIGPSVSLEPSEPHDSSDQALPRGNLNKKPVSKLLPAMNNSSVEGDQNFYETGHAEFCWCGHKPCRHDESNSSTEPNSTDTDIADTNSSGSERLNATSTTPLGNNEATSSIQPASDGPVDDAGLVQDQGAITQPQTSGPDPDQQTSNNGSSNAYSSQPSNADTGNQPRPTIDLMFLSQWAPATNYRRQFPKVPLEDPMQPAPLIVSHPTWIPPGLAVASLHRVDRPDVPSYMYEPAVRPAPTDEEELLLSRLREENRKAQEHQDEDEL